LGIFSRRSKGVELIVANLPYIAMEDMSELSPRFTGPAYGTRRRQVTDYGSSSGWRTRPPRILHGLLALEIGASQAEAVSRILEARNYQDIRAERDYQGRDRFVFAKYG
jgi:methylase of polypeptide subunit release factors